MSILQTFRVPLLEISKPQICENFTYSIWHKPIIGLVELKPLQEEYYETTEEVSYETVKKSTITSCFEAKMKPIQGLSEIFDVKLSFFLSANINFFLL